MIGLLTRRTWDRRWMPVLALLATLAMLGCQGRPSRDAPIHLNPNMDDQEKYQAQEISEFFLDGMSMRLPPEGTVARGELWEDDAYYRGRDSRDSLIEVNPVDVTMPLLRRGRQRFNIYCSPCHGRTGDGRGIMVSRGYVPPPAFHDQRLRDASDGYLFDVITNGVRNMPSYASQVPVADRWAIVAYLRALQRSHSASLEDIPAAQRGQAGQ